MQISATRLPEVLVLEPSVHADARGVVWESFNAETLRAAAGIQAPFMLDVHSHSTRGVLRGLHYQLPPHDPALGIEWPDVGMPPRLSARDARAAGFDTVPRFG
jgi:dTDP-4-dehydrorhamnose 3,5-epimerase-like enzyme